MRFLREAVEVTIGAPSLLEAIPDPPSDIAHAQRFAFILAFVPGTAAKLAAETGAAIDNAAAAAATRAGEPMPDATEMQRCRQYWDHLVEGLRAAASGMAVVEPESIRVEAVSDRACPHTTLAVPAISAPGCSPGGVAPGG